MRTNRTRRLTRAAVVGGLYAALALLGSVFGISYGAIQCRFAEALCVLPFLFPETAWGLGVGCLITNLFSPAGLPDIIIGSLTTLGAALLTRRCRSEYFAPLPPVVLNGVVVGGLLTFEEVGFTSAFGKSFWFNGCSVLVGEAIACYGLGLLLIRTLEKRGLAKEKNGK